MAIKFGHKIVKYAYDLINNGFVYKKTNRLHLVAVDLFGYLPELAHWHMAGLHPDAAFRHFDSVSNFEAYMNCLDFAGMRPFGQQMPVEWTQLDAGKPSMECLGPVLERKNEKWQRVWTLMGLDRLQNEPAMGQDCPTIFDPTKRF